MAKLSELSEIDRQHWELHLNAVAKDTPTLTREVKEFLRGAELPNIKHPSNVHDWLEIPEMRAYLEALDG